MTVNFLGLAGALGPLPAPYSEMILAAAARKDHAAADFLDIFNHRLVLLFYRVRQAHSPALTSRAPHEGSAAQYLFSLIGLNLPAMRQRLGIPAQSLLQYAGLLAGMPRSMAGLERILADYFTVPVRVRQFIGGWRLLDRSQWTAIGADGSNQELGAGAVLGRRVWDDEKSVSIVIGPVGWSIFLEFLPQGARHRALAALARFYLGPDRAEARLLLKAADVPRAAIGQSRLGYTSWLLRQPFKGSNPSVRIALEN
jgi:type VI secretion system protein ImpH